MKPFLKWAGGKTLVYNATSQFFPKEFNTYIEPFLGGGAVYFNLAPKKAILSDINTSLINCYLSIKNSPEELMSELNVIGPKASKEFYLETRNSFNENPNELSIEKAAQFIFLNKTCFNGIFRVNKSGKFNVPYGDNRLKIFFEKENILEITNSFKENIQILNQDFRKTVLMAKEGDFIYLDPPYQVKSDSFTSYTAGGFSNKDREDLTECLYIADKKGVKIVLSNSKDNYFGDSEIFNKSVIERGTSVSGYTKVRIKTPEYIYTNF